MLKGVYGTGETQSGRREVELGEYRRERDEDGGGGRKESGRRANVAGFHMRTCRNNAGCLARSVSRYILKFDVESQNCTEARFDLHQDTG